MKNKKKFRHIEGWCWCGKAHASKQDLPDFVKSPKPKEKKVRIEEINYNYFSQNCIEINDKLNPVIVSDSDKEEFIYNKINEIIKVINSK